MDRHGLFCFSTPSNASALAVFRSNFVPAFLLKTAKERSDIEFHSPEAFADRQPTRRNSSCSDVISSDPDGAAEADGGSAASLVSAVEADFSSPAFFAFSPAAREVSWSAKRDFSLAATPSFFGRDLPQLDLSKIGVEAVQG